MSETLAEDPNVKIRKVNKITHQKDKRQSSQFSIIYISKDEEEVLSKQHWLHYVVTQLLKC